MWVEVMTDEHVMSLAGRGAGWVRVVSGCEVWRTISLKGRCLYMGSLVFNNKGVHKGDSHSDYIIRSGMNGVEFNGSVV